MVKRCGEYHTKMMKEAAGVADKIYHFICQKTAYEILYNIQTKKNELERLKN